jgi:hypothetical protein
VITHVTILGMILINRLTVLYVTPLVIYIYLPDNLLVFSPGIQHETTVHSYSPLGSIRVSARRLLVLALWETTSDARRADLPHDVPPRPSSA